MLLLLSCILVSTTLLLCRAAATQSSTVAALISAIRPAEVGFGGGVSLTIFARKFPVVDDAELLLLASTGFLSVFVGPTECPIDLDRTVATRVVCGPIPPANDTFLASTLTVDLPDRISVPVRVKLLNSFIESQVTLAYLRRQTPTLLYAPAVAMAGQPMYFSASLPSSVTTAASEASVVSWMTQYLSVSLLRALPAPSSPCEWLPASVPHATTTASTTSGAASDLAGNAGPVTPVALLQTQEDPVTGLPVEFLIYRCGLAIHGPSGTAIFALTAHHPAGEGRGRAAMPFRPTRPFAPPYRLDDTGLGLFSTHVFATVASLTPRQLPKAMNAVVLTIAGSGFGTQTTAVQVLVGASNRPCEVFTALPTQIECIYTPDLSVAANAQTTPGNVGSLKRTYAVDGVDVVASPLGIDDLTRLQIGITTGTVAPISTEVVTTDMSLSMLASPADYIAAASRTSVTTTTLSFTSLSPTPGRFAHTLSSIFVPAITGSYRFWCTSTDFVTVTIDGADVCAAEKRSVRPFLRYFDVLTASINDTLSTAGGRSYRTVSQPLSLVANSRYAFVIAYGTSGAKSSYTVSFTLDRPPPTTTTTTGAPAGFSAAPGASSLPTADRVTVAPSNPPSALTPSSFVRVLSNRANFTTGRTQSFTLSYNNSEFLRVPFLNAGYPCSALGLADRLEAAFASVRADETIIDFATDTVVSGGTTAAPSAALDGCAWLLELPAPSELPNLTVQLATATMLFAAKRDTLLFEPAPARMFRVPFASLPTTQSDDIPVSVFIGGQPAAHSSSPSPFKQDALAAASVKLSVAHSDTAAPFVSWRPPTYNPITGGTAGMSIVATTVAELTGDGLLAVADKILFLFIPVAAALTDTERIYRCDNVSVAVSSVTCVTPELPADFYRVLISLHTLGVPAFEGSSPSLYFQAVPVLTTVSPSIGSLAGGTIITLTGTGFPLAAATGTASVLPTSTRLQVFVGADLSSALAADVLGVTSNNIWIRAPRVAAAVTPGVAATLVSDVRIVVTVPVAQQMPILAQTAVISSATHARAKFTATATGMPSVASVSPNRIAGGSATRITLVGSLLDSVQSVLLCLPLTSAVSVPICVPTDVDAATSSNTLTFTTLGAGNASYTLTLLVPGYGSAAQNVSVTSTFFVSSISPAVVSWLGLGELSITGAGFDAATTVVTVDGATCAVIAARTNYSNLVCELTEAFFFRGAALPVMVRARGGPQAECADAVAGCTVRSEAFGGIPVIKGVAPAKGQKALLTITGLNFVKDQVDVQVGDNECFVEHFVQATGPSSSSTFYCRIREYHRGGSFPILVRAHPFGLVPTELSFLYPMSITDARPTSGSVAGGTLVTISGSGFSRATTVMIADVACLFDALHIGTSMSPTQLICATGSRPVYVEASGPFVVTSQSASAVYGRFTYSVSSTVSVARIVPLTGVEGSVVNISGVGLPRSVNVSIAGIPISVVTVIPGGISVVLPQVPALKAQLDIVFAGGRAWTPAQQFVVFPTVVSVSPLTSPFAGGTTLTIKGARFSTGDLDRVWVTLCGVPCPVLSKNFSTVTCVTPPQHSTAGYAISPRLEPQAFVASLPLDPYLEVAATNARRLVDRDLATAFVVSRVPGVPLIVGVDIGDQTFAFFTAMRVLPGEGNSSALRGATVQVAEQAGRWTSLWVMRDPHEGWNDIALVTTASYGRYVRIVLAETVDAVSVAEVELAGVIASSRTATNCPLVLFVRRGDADATTETVSTCSERPAKCIEEPLLITYDSTSSPTIDSVDPIYVDATSRSTSRFTFTGRNLVAAPNATAAAATESIYVAGSLCTLATAAADIVICNANRVPTALYRSRSPSQLSGNVTNLGDILVKTDPPAFGSLWSASSTWSNRAPPRPGEDIVIPAFTTLILDVSPVPLGRITVFGSLFIPGTKDIVLTCGSIEIDRGGSLRVGTASQPASSWVRIVLTGDGAPTTPPRSISVRDGTLTMYGTVRSPSFSVLQETALTGATSITVRSVGWIAGDVVAIAATDLDPSHIEYRVITAVVVGASRSVIRLDEPLAYRHAGDSELGFGTKRDLGAEVALVSRQISVSGGEARFANTAGGVASLDSGVGAVVLVNTRGKNTASSVEISGVLFEQAGQRRRGSTQALAAITFRRNGDLPTSAISSCVFIDTYDTAISFEDTNRVKVSRVTIISPRGHGIATLRGNSRSVALDNTLVMFPRTALDGAAATAAFYVTHPSVTVRSCVAAGGNFAGFWYDLVPTDTDWGMDVDPSSAALGLFKSNTAHSQRGFGLLIPQHVPTTAEGSTVSGSGSFATATIDSFLAYKNNVGVSLGKVAAYVITAAWISDSLVSGIEVGSVVTSASVKVSLSYVIAHTPSGVRNMPPAAAVLATRGAAVVAGIVTPASEGFLVENVTLTGYNASAPAGGGGGAATTHVPFVLCRDCDPPAPFLAGAWRYPLVGFTVRMKAVTLDLSDVAASFRAPYVSALVDADGSMFQRGPNATLVPMFAHLDGLPGCEVNANTSRLASAGPLPVMVCDSTVRLHAFIAYGTSPSTLNKYNISVAALTQSTSDTTSRRQSVAFRPTTSAAVGTYGFFLPSSTAFVVAPGAATTSITQRPRFSLSSDAPASLGSKDWTLLQLQLGAEAGTPLSDVILQIPFSAATASAIARYDVGRQLPTGTASSLPSTGNSASQATSSSDVLPTYYADATSAEQAGIIDKAFPESNRTTRTIFDYTGRTTYVILVPYDSPFDALTVSQSPCPVATGCLRMLSRRENKTFSWSDTRAWDSGALPADGDDVVIPAGYTITLGSTTARLRSLIIQGALVFHPRLAASVLATYVVVFGGSMSAGTVAEPHTSPVSIRLLSDSNLPWLGVDARVILPPGTLAIFGTVSIFAAATVSPWGALGSTLLATRGTNATVAMQSSTDWVAGDVVAISSGSFNGSEVDFVAASGPAPDGRGVLLSTAVAYDHIAVAADVSSTTKLHYNAHAAMLSRLVVIEPGLNGTGRSGGCTVLFADIGNDWRFSASGTLQGVEVRYCGRNQTSKNTVVTALTAGSSSSSPAPPPPPPPSSSSNASTAPPASSPVGPVPVTTPSSTKGRPSAQSSLRASIASECRLFDAPCTGRSVPPCTSASPHPG